MKEKKKYTVEELEQIRQELTEQLIQSERMRSLGSLSSGVAHHFNNLLSVILGYASLVLNKEDLSEEAREALQKVSEAAQRGRRLTEELLAFAGSDVEEEMACNIHSTLTNVLSLLQSQVHSLVQVESRLDAQKDEVLATQSEIHQVVFNLLTNAFDSMPDGGSLKIKTSNTEIEGDEGTQEYLRIEVEDSGGPAQDFEVPDADGFSAETFVPRDAKALKLSSIYGLVGKLDGTVLMSTAPGSMRKVQVLLPTTTPIRGGRVRQPERRRLTPSLIWIVDDDPVFREMCHMVLSEQGHDIMELPGGKELQKAWGEAVKPPDLIVIDFSMPDYNGLELSEWLSKKGSRVPIILVSGLSPNHPDIRKALGMKRIFFLQKPFTFRELADVVTVAMGETLLGE